MLSRSSKGLEGKPRVAVNFGGMLGGSRRYEPCTRGRMRSRRLSPGIGYIESLHAQRPVIEWLLEPLFLGACQKWATTRAKCRTNRVVISDTRVMHDPDRSLTSPQCALEHHDVAPLTRRIFNQMMMLRAGSNLESALLRAAKAPYLQQ